MRCLLTLALLFSLTLVVRADGIDFFHGSWEEALAKAAEEEKLIFVDAYASWCGPCKRMSANVFPQKEVGDFHNANFINVKYDMEKDESADFRKTHRASAYPTLLYINAKNEVVHKSVGGKSAESLIMTGNAALAKLDDLETLTEKWTAGNREAKFAFKYVRALVRNNENHLRVANDYLRQPTGSMTDEYNLRLLTVATTDADSRLFDLLLDYRQDIIALEGQATFDAVVQTAVDQTMDKAVEYRDEDLMDTAVKRMAAVDKATAKRLQYEGAYRLAMRGTDAKAFAKAADKYLDKGAAGDEDRLRQLYATASDSKFANEPAVIEVAAAAGAAAAAMNPVNGWRDYYNVANFLHKKGQAERAVEMARRSLTALPDSLKTKNYRKAIEQLIGRIEADL